jgi:mannosyltransferase
VSTSTIQLGAGVTSPRQFRRPLGIRLIALVLGGFGAVVSFAGSWIPSFWGDEAASVMSAERPLGTLWRELGRVDAVHGTYYLFLHFWIDAFGASELSVRLPSALAVGVAVAGVVVLANLLAGRRVAVISGVVMAVLPRVMLMGAEGRSYAMSAAVAVWLTVVLVVLLRRREPASTAARALPWVGYCALMAFSVYLFLYLVMLVGIHLLVVLSSPRNRSQLRRWALAAAAAVVVASPVLYFGLKQRHQIHFLGGRGYATTTHILVTQWFGNWYFAVPALLALLAGIVAVAMRHRGSAVLLLGWLLLPTTLILLGNAFVSPMYNERYLSFSTPAVAIVMGIGLAAISRNPLRVAAVALIVVAAVPSWVSERAPYAKDRSIVFPDDSGSDLRQAAAVVGAQAQPGDGVVFDETVRPSRRPRLALHLYPQDFTGLTDLALKTPYYDTAGLWDTVKPITTSVVAGTKTIWAIEFIGTSTPAGVLRLEQLGYTVTQELPVSRTVVYELTREIP